MERRRQPVSCPDLVVERCSSFSGSVVREKPSEQVVLSEHRPGKHVGSGHEGLQEPGSSRRGPKHARFPGKTRRLWLFPLDLKNRS